MKNFFLSACGLLTLLFFSLNKQMIGAIPCHKLEWNDKPTEKRRTREINLKMIGGLKHETHRHRSRRRTVSIFFFYKSNSTWKYFYTLRKKNIAWWFCEYFAFRRRRRRSLLPFIYGAHLILSVVAHTIIAV